MSDAAPLCCNVRDNASLVAITIKDEHSVLFNIPVTQALTWLHKVHMLVDNLAEQHNVAKLPSEGCSFLMGAGVDRQDSDHAAHALSFARALLGSVHQVHSPHSGEPMQWQVALHAGRVSTANLGHRTLKLQTFGAAVLAVQTVVVQAPANTLMATDAFLLKLRSASSWQMFRSLDAHTQSPMPLYILQSLHAQLTMPGLAASELNPLHMRSTDQTGLALPYAFNAGNEISAASCMDLCSQYPRLLDIQQARSQQAVQQPPLEYSSAPPSANGTSVDKGLLAQVMHGLCFKDANAERCFQLQRAAKMHAPDVGYMACTTALQLYVLWTMGLLGRFGTCMMVLALWPLLLALAAPQLFQQHRTALLVVGRSLRCGVWFTKCLLDSSSMLARADQALIVRTTLSNGLIWCMMHAVGTGLPLHVHIPFQAVNMLVVVMVDHAHCNGTAAGPGLPECQPSAYPIMVALHTLLLFLLPTMLIRAYEVSARLAFLSGPPTRKHGKSA